MNSLAFKSVADLMAGVARMGSIDGKNKVSRAVLRDVKYQGRAKQVRYVYTFKPQGENQPASLYQRVYGKQYRTVIVFGRVSAQDTRDKQHPHSIGKVFTQTPNNSSNPVKVSCTCPRFQHAYAFSNKKRKALPPEFTPIPYDNYQAKLNPTEVQGACKHIIAALRSSKRRRLLR